MRHLSRTAVFVLLGVFSFGCAAWGQGQIKISGLPSATTPLSGSEIIPLNQGGVTKSASVTSIRGNNPGSVTGAIKSNGSGTYGRAACADLSNAATSCSTDATNATNLSAGTVPVARLPVATTGALGAVRPDGTSITISGGIITAITGGSGTVTTTGGPGSPNLTCFSGATSITNCNLSGDATTSGAAAVTVTKTNGVSFAPSATTDTTNASNISSGTVAVARLPLATTGAFGVAKPDGTSITISAGVISATSGGAVLSIGSGSNSLTGPAAIFVCTSTCSITPPVPGYQFCIENDASVSTVITIASPGGSVLFQKAVTPGTANGYGSAGGHMTSGGAFGDLVCLVGRDSTHYLAPSFGGTWTNS